MGEQKDVPPGQEAMVSDHHVTIEAIEADAHASLIKHARSLLTAAALRLCEAIFIAEHVTPEAAWDARLLATRQYLQAWWNYHNAQKPKEEQQTIAECQIWVDWMLMARGVPLAYTEEPDPATYRYMRGLMLGEFDPPGLP